MNGPCANAGPSGAWCGRNVALSPAPLRRCPSPTVRTSWVRAGSRAPASTTPRTSCDGGMTVWRWWRWMNPARDRRSATPSCAKLLREWRRSSMRGVWHRAIVSPAGCRMAGRRWSPCWPRRAWARCGHLARRTSAATVRWIALARSTPSSSSPPGAIATAAMPSRWRPRCSKCGPPSRPSRHCCGRRTSPASSTNARKRRWTLPSVASTLPFTSSIRQAPPGRRSASSTASAARCCSI